MVFAVYMPPQAPAPGQECAEQVHSQRQLAVLGRRAVREQFSLVHPLPDLHHRSLVDTGVLIGTPELDHIVGVHICHSEDLVQVAGLAVPDNDLIGRKALDHARALGKDQVAGIRGHLALQPGTHKGRLGNQERHGLALHIGSHQRPVGIIMLQERNKRCRR